MRTEVRFLVGAGLFGLIVSVVYWFLSYEDAGTVFLMLMGTAVVFIGAYLLHRGRKLRRAEDDPEADHAEQAGERVGYFSEGSVWPLVMGLGVGIGVEGFIYGAWLLFFGVVLFVWAAVGLMMESRG